MEVKEGDRVVGVASAKPVSSGGRSYRYWGVTVLTATRANAGHLYWKSSGADRDTTSEAKLQDLAEAKAERLGLQYDNNLRNGDRCNSEVAA